MMRSVVLVICIAAPAAAEPARAAAELRVHVGDSEQDEVAHYGLFPSLVIGGALPITDSIELGASIAAAKVTASWENIGGLANGILEARTTRNLAAGKVTLGGGVAFPLDDSIPAADCFMPEKADGGDSLVLDYGANPACWDRSAYRRAALHRGGWNAWLWAPDFITAAATARLDGRHGDLHYAAEAGAGLAFAITGAHDDGKRAVIGQAAGEAAYAMSARWRVGVRALIAGVVLDDESPLLVSAEPYAEVVPSVRFRLRASVLVPVVDLSNADVPPGLGGYVPRENVSIGFAAVVTIDG